MVQSALFSLCHPQLRRHQPIVNPLFLQQLIVRANLRNAVAVNYYKPVCIPQGREPVGNGEGSPPLHQPVKGLLDQEFTLRIQSGCSLGLFRIALAMAILCRSPPDRL